MQPKLFLPKFFISVGLLFLAGFISTETLADQIYVEGWLGGYSHKAQVTTTGGTANVSGNGLTGAYNSTTSFGCVQLRVDSFYPGYPYTSGYADGSGWWSDTITIQPDNSALLGTPGTAVFTYYLNGSTSSTDYTLCQFNVTTECSCGGPSTYGGTPIVSSFTISRSFTFGSPLSLQMTLSALAHNSNGEHTMDVSLTAGGITVTDNSGNPVAYSSVSSVGAARSLVLSNGGSYASFSFTNTLSHHTAAALLAGAANTNETLTAAFTGSPGTNGVASDVMDFSGTGTNQFVLQMAYDVAAVVAQGIGETNLSLQWFNPVLQIWTNAIHGNSDGGTNSQFFSGAFDLSKFKLGNWGVDTITKTVWAVLDHNSRFSAGGIAAPPALRCTGITPKTNGVAVFLQGQPAGPIFVDQLSDLITTNWVPLGRAIPDMNGAASFFDAGLSVTNSRRFYRARQ